jgi:hypothetical protein
MDNAASHHDSNQNPQKLNVNVSVGKGDPDNRSGGDSPRSATSSNSSSWVDLEGHEAQQMHPSQAQTAARNTPPVTVKKDGRSGTTDRPSGAEPSTSHTGNSPTVSQPAKPLHATAVNPEMDASIVDLGDVHHREALSQAPRHELKQGGGLNSMEIDDIEFRPTLETQSKKDHSTPRDGTK